MGVERGDVTVAAEKAKLQECWLCVTWYDARTSFGGMLYALLVQRSGMFDDAGQRGEMAAGLPLQLGRRSAS